MKELWALSQMMTCEQELRCGKHQSYLEILGESSRRCQQLRIGTFPKTCALALLLFCDAALFKDHPELNLSPNLPKRRLTQKGLPDAYLVKILGRLQADVDEALLPWGASWKRRRNAYYEYGLDC